MFIDEAEIYIHGGDGGHGCVSFRREKYVPMGGPNGGSGGDGGGVYAVATPGVETLLDFSGRHHWNAKNGLPGEGKQKTGKSGDDLDLKLPHGTLIYDRDTGLLLKDLTQLGERVCIAPGGKGGRGNKAFATPTQQAPQEAEPGTPGEERWLRLVLKLIADVGLVGLPNAGKSTLLASTSKAAPKIAPYPFTTLKPQLGIAELPGFRRIVIADIPGLIEGAHEGAGLGDAFLKHIERTRVIVHLVDLFPPEGDPTPADAYRTIREELGKSSQTLADKPELVVATKTDIDPDSASDKIDALKSDIGKPVSAISSATREGLDQLMEEMWRLVASEKPPQEPEPVKQGVIPPHLRSFS